MATAAAVISFQLMPAKKITKMPEAAIKIEVPRSGCFAIKMVGTNTITNEANKVLNDGGRACLPM
ncbi:Uncharacterised protein [Vibrio cholerae]|nr:Uncharacterised protein [Vibrio cholerae]